MIANADDKRKSTEQKVTDRNAVESVGRAGLIYTNPDIVHQKVHVSILVSATLNKCMLKKK